jgi:hypothetical protein
MRAAKTKEINLPDISNIEQLRDHALATIKRLNNGQLSVEEAGVTAKLYESVISASKTELAYHHMLGQKPKIEFLEGAKLVQGNIIDANPQIFLEKKSSKVGGRIKLEGKGKK